MDFLVIVAMFLPLAFWWRFRDVSLDRDFCPYGYPAVFRTGYLKDGHVDIKPPLIHWGYKLWLYIMPPSRFGLKWTMRLLPALSNSLTCLLLYIGTGSPVPSLVYGFLTASPTLWNHMANTEWMGNFLLALSLPATLIDFRLGALVLGTSWLVNIKNIPISLVVGGVLGMGTTLLWTFVPLALATFYLLITKRGKAFWDWVLIKPMKMGKARSLRTHTNWALILGGTWILSPIMAVGNWQSGWLFVLLLTAGVIIAAKQIVPHHLIWLLIPIAMIAEPGPLTILAVMLVWIGKDWAMWRDPSRTYPLTFFSGNGAHYGHILTDSKDIEDWIRKNTDKDERIWVNGMENHVYLNAQRKSVQVNIPEFTEPPKEFPRVVVHSLSGQRGIPDDLVEEGWEVKLVSKLGLYYLLVKA